MEIQYVVIFVIAIGIGIFFGTRKKWGPDTPTTYTPPRSPSSANVSDFEGLLAQVPELRQLIAQGEMIDAIKRVRAATGLGLKEAKDVVEELKNRLEGKPAGPTPNFSAHAIAHTAEDVVAQHPEIRQMIESGKTIDAIVVVRTATGLGLKEAKDLVEEINSKI